MPESNPVLEIVLVTVHLRATWGHIAAPRYIARTIQAHGGKCLPVIQVLVFARTWRFKSSHPHH